jgi:hypothetical protein
MIPSDVPMGLSNNIDDKYLIDFRIVMECNSRHTP